LEVISGAQQALHPADGPAGQQAKVHLSNLLIRNQFLHLHPGSFGQIYGAAAI
jgi:hypothetical protein